MPYAPGIEYHGDRELYDAIGSLGQDAADALQKRQQMSKEDSYNDMIVQHAYEQGTGPFADPKQKEAEWNKYQAMSHSAKTGYAAGLAANIVSDWKQQQESAQTQEAQARTALAKAQLAQTGPFARDPMEGQTYYHPTTGEAIGTHGPNGQVQYFPTQATGGNDAVITDPVKIGDREIGGVGVNRKTGQYLYFKDSGIERDTKTGALGTRDVRGNFKPLTAQQVTAMAIDPNNPLQQTQTPQSNDSATHWWNPATWGKGGGSAAAPATTAAPGQTPTPSASVAPAGKMRVISPQGVPGFIPAERLRDYLAAGYTQG